MSKTELKATAIRFEYPRSDKQVALDAQDEIFDLLDAGWVQIHPTRLVGDTFRVVLLKIQEDSK